MSRPDYCPIGNQPCQSICTDKCGSRPAPVQVPEGYRFQPHSEFDAMNAFIRGETKVPPGHALVPVEPTPEMLAAVSWPGCARTDYAHMLAAAPSAPSVAYETWSQEQVDAIKAEAAALLPKFKSKPVTHEEGAQGVDDAAPPAASGCDYHAVAQFLYGLLDDIDTAGDMAKADDGVYRRLVESIQARKREAVAKCDGYTVTFKTPAIANQEAQDGR